MTSVRRHFDGTSKLKITAASHFDLLTDTNLTSPKLVCAWWMNLSCSFHSKIKIFNPLAGAWLITFVPSNNTNRRCFNIFFIFLDIWRKLERLISGKRKKMDGGGCWLLTRKECIDRLILWEMRNLTAASPHFSAWRRIGVDPAQILSEGKWRYMN